MAREGDNSPISKLKQEREQVVQVLSRLREALEAEIDSDFQEGDPGLAERERIMALKQNLMHKVESLDYALSRASEGLYGICEVCGNPIDPARLEAMPETTLCVGCKANQKRQPVIRAHVGPG